MPSPTPKARRTQRRLLDAAAAELLRTGGSLQLQTVATTAGVVPSVVSHHFGSRSGLIAAVVDEYYDRLHQQVLDLDLRAIGDWFARERERVGQSIDFLFRQPLTPVVFGPLSRDPQVAAVEARRVAGVVEQSAGNIAAAQRAGELRGGVDPLLAGACIFGATRQLVLAAFSRDQRPARDTVVTQLWRVTVASVTPELLERES